MQVSREPQPKINNVWLLLKMAHQIIFCTISFLISFKCVIWAQTLPLDEMTECTHASIAIKESDHMLKGSRIQEIISTEEDPQTPLLHSPTLIFNASFFLFSVFS